MEQQHKTLGYANAWTAAEVQVGKVRQELAKYAEASVIQDRIRLIVAALFAINMIDGRNEAGSAP